MPKYVSLAELADHLREGSNYLICGHISPDGDCIGAQLALAEALRSMGKTVTCLLAKADPLEYGLSLLPGVSDMVPAKDFAGEFDTFITVDVPHIKRMGEEATALYEQAARTITIDHHLSLEPVSDYCYIDDASPATALMVWDVINQLDVQPTPSMASACYVGLMTDTGRFQYQNTTAAALYGASRMVEAGANPAKLATLMYQNRSFESLVLEERMLSKARVSANGQLAYSFLTIEDFAETGATRPDAEPLIDVLRSIRGVRVACLLREQDSSVRGSLRAKDDIDVAAIAAQFGGGGHKAAAGFTFEGNMEDAIASLTCIFEDLENTL